MNIEISFISHIPIYVQLVDQIKHKIAVGELKPGDQLPTVRQLAADLRVNFNTVARAYRLLDEDKIISTQHGRGTFILEPVSQKDLESIKEKDLTRLTDYYIFEASKLGASPKEVESIFKKKMAQWKKDGQVATPDSNY